MYVNDFNKPLLDELSKLINSGYYAISGKVEHVIITFLIEALKEAKVLYYEMPSFGFEIDYVKGSVEVKAHDVYTALLLMGYYIDRPMGSLLYYFDNYTKCFYWNSGDPKVDVLMVPETEENPYKVDLDKYRLWKVETPLLKEYKERVACLI